MRRNPRLPLSGGPLDQAIQRFQHQWETNRQFRTLWSTVAAVVVVVVLCSCLATISTIVSRTVAGFTNDGGSANAQGTPNTGVGLYQAASTFPTQTSGPLPKPNIPAASPIPNSQTPQPTSAAATPTIDTGGGPGGPGGGSNVTACSGGNGGVTWSLNPCPLKHGQGGSLYIHAPGYVGHTFNLVLSVCATNCGIVYQPDASRVFDSNGDFTVGFGVPDSAANSGVPVSGMINITGGPTVSVLAAPTQ